MLEALAAVGSVTGFGVAAWPGARRHVFMAAVVASVVSIAVSACALLGAGRSSGWLSLVESFALLGLVFLALRRAPAPLGVVGAAAAAAAVLVIIPSHVTAADSVLANVAGVAVWGFGAALAAGAARYLEALDRRRARSVADARREQRLSLARDLHDFVAHDVSAIVVQAQAAQVVGGGEPEAALRRIEAAGLHALAAMDRAVEALRDASRLEPSTHTLDELRELARRFESTAAPRVELDVDDGVAAQAPAAAQSAAYRLVCEGLTNVRRHARDATAVRIVVGSSHLGTEPALAVSVANDGAAPARGARGALRRGGGFGLPGLHELVAACGGTLEAGPDGDAGWRLSALLPLRDQAVDA